MQTEEFAVKKVRVYFKEIMPNPEYRWGHIQRPGPPMASSDEFYKGKIINCGAVRVMVYWLVSASGGDSWSLHLVLMATMLSLYLVLQMYCGQSPPAFLGLELNTTEARISLLWLKFCFCGQQSWGFLPKIIWCWPDLLVLRACWLRESLCKGEGPGE